MYFNAIFAVMTLFFLYKRLKTGLTFDRSIHMLYIISEAILIDLFLLAFLSDLITTNLNSIYTIGLVFTLFAVTFFIV